MQTILSVEYNRIWNVSASLSLWKRTNRLNTILECLSDVETCLTYFLNFCIPMIVCGSFVGTDLNARLTHVNAPKIEKRNEN